MKEVTSQCDILSQALPGLYSCRLCAAARLWWLVAYKIQCCINVTRPLARAGPWRCAASVFSALYTMLYVYVRTRCVCPPGYRMRLLLFTNVGVICSWYLVTRCLLLDAGFGVCQHTTLVEVPNPFQPIKSCYNIDPPFYKGVPQPETLDLDLHFYKL
jgi:hypothetical protein